MHATHRRPARRGFTLIELLVVVAIIGLISAVALPMVLPALNERRVNEAARELQAILAGCRDAAIRANNGPRGIRLLPDPVFNGQQTSQPGIYNPLASNRIIPIETAPDYTEGLVSAGTVANYLVVFESGKDPISGVPNNPTNWSLNVRQGDKIRFNDSGAYYTIAGPISGPPYLANNSNTERVITCTPSSPVPLASQAGWVPEYLYLMNGIDDNGNGWVDEACDGIDNDGDGKTDPGFNGVDDNGDGVIDDFAELFIGNEYEKEVFIGSQASTPPFNVAYTIVRRPVVSPGAREVTLPAGVVIDLTMWDAASNGFLPERSRLPVDPFTGRVDIMIDQTGRVVTPGAGSGSSFYTNSPLSNAPFYHFWLTEREGVASVRYPPPAMVPPLLPIPPSLTGERRLVTLFVKTGQIVTNSIQNFSPTDVNYPFYDAQAGIKEPL
jgi:prepilin-type N-terminal cleavage/methylation domain-containing protein